MSFLFFLIFLSPIIRSSLRSGLVWFAPPLCSVDYRSAHGPFFWIKRETNPVWPPEQRIHKQTQRIAYTVFSIYAHILRVYLITHLRARACVGRSVLPPNGRSGLRLRGLLRAHLPLFRELRLLLNRSAHPWGILETGWGTSQQVARTCTPTQVPDYPRTIRSSMSLLYAQGPQ